LETHIDVLLSFIPTSEFFFFFKRTELIQDRVSILYQIFLGSRLESGSMVEANSQNKIAAFILFFTLPSFFRIDGRHQFFKGGQYLRF
jgi:hypothetical protein